jgi:hypothetical protein
MRMGRTGLFFYELRLTSVEPGRKLTIVRLIPQRQLSLAKFDMIIAERNRMELQMLDAEQQSG